MDGQSSGDVTNGHLVRKFLDFTFLERVELGSTRTHEQLALGLVLRTLLRGTLDQRRESTGIDLLEHFVTALVASVGVDHDRGFDVRYTRDDTTHGDQLAKTVTFDLTHGKRGERLAGVSASQRLEIQRVPARELGWKQLRFLFGDFTHDFVVAGLACLGCELGTPLRKQTIVSELPLVQDHVQDVVLVVELAGGRGQQLVDGAREKLDEVVRVADDCVDEVRGGGVSGVPGERLAVLVAQQVIELDEKRLDLTVGDLLEKRHVLGALADAHGREVAVLIHDGACSGIVGLEVQEKVLDAGLELRVVDGDLDRGQSRAHG